jgi:hypothetical protein
MKPTPPPPPGKSKRGRLRRRKEIEEIELDLDDKTAPVIDPDGTDMQHQDVWLGEAAEIDLQAEMQAMEDVTSELPFAVDEIPAYIPEEPKTFERTGLTRTFIEHLVLKYLLSFPGVTGNEVADALCLHRDPIRELLRDLKQRMLVVHAKGNAPMDFHYDLTEAGRGMALDLRRQNAYAGPAPVTMAHYVESVLEQSISREPVHRADLEDAFEGLVVHPELLNLLGPAMTSGKGMFLFGNPGNGKTSIALRMAKAFRGNIFVPHCVLMNGTLVQVLDPQVHHKVQHPAPQTYGRERLDARWVECKRPVVVAGGELTLDSLELEPTGPGQCEAPLQLKANCGIFLIDDFGRQRVDKAELLNRWIIPLEERLDYLRLPSGRKVQVPFDPMLVFSTNLDPKELVDEAFLRRIPYKIEFADPDPRAFRRVLGEAAEAMGFIVDEAAVDYLIDTYYKKTGRGMRYCHPRDLLLQVRNRCLFNNTPLELTEEAFDYAAWGYFTLL